MAAEATESKRFSMDIVTVNLCLRPPGVTFRGNDYKDQRCNRFVKWIEETRPAICCIQEFFNWSGRKKEFKQIMKERLSDEYDVVFCSDAIDLESKEFLCLNRKYSKKRFPSCYPPEEEDEEEEEETTNLSTQQRSHEEHPPVSWFERNMKNYFRCSSSSSSELDNQAPGYEIDANQHSQSYSHYNTDLCSNLLLFAKQRRLYIKQNQSYYNSWSRFVSLIDSGLVILIRRDTFELKTPNGLYFKKYDNPGCSYDLFANKGFLAVVLQHKASHNPVLLVNTHLQAIYNRNNIGQVESRNSQMAELGAFVSQMMNVYHHLIVCGDFNTNYNDLSDKHCLDQNLLDKVVMHKNYDIKQPRLCDGNSFYGNSNQDKKLQSSCQNLMENLSCSKIPSSVLDCNHYLCYKNQIPPTQLIDHVFFVNLHGTVMIDTKIEDSIEITLEDFNEAQRLDPKIIKHVGQKISLSDHYPVVVQCRPIGW